MEKVTIKIDSLSYKGRGVGRVDNIVYFVPLAAPEDLLEIEITGREKHFRTGCIVKIIEPSPCRVEPVCPYFGKCGGCNWQHVSYKRQLSEKKNILKETIIRIGKTGADIDPVIPSPKVYGYRNRTRVKFFRDGKIGFYEAESNRLIEIDNCPVLSPGINGFLQRLKSESFPKPVPKGEIDIYEDSEGSLRYSFISSDKKDIMPFSQVNHGINSLLKERIRLLIKEYMHGRSKPDILDLYCGDGNLSLHLSGIAGSINGWDLSAAAVKKGMETVRRNNLKNIVYKKGDISKNPAAAGKLSGRFELLIIDPPRRGLKGMVSSIAGMGVPLIFYISCVPPVLARDLRDFLKEGYVIKKIIPFDMFPQTYHIETLSVLMRP